MPSTLADHENLFQLVYKTSKLARDQIRLQSFLNHSSRFECSLEMRFPLRSSFLRSVCSRLCCFESESLSESESNRIGKETGDSESSQLHENCETCQTILEFFEKTPEFYVDFDLGSKKEVLDRSQCQEHTKILKYALGEALLHPEIDRISIEKYSANPNVQFQAWSHSREPIEGSIHHFIRLLRHDGNSSLTSAIRVHPLWIDDNLFRLWKHSCDQFHHQHCKDWSVADALSSTGPQWLVDVWNGCLVKTTPDHSYVALSYVWESDQDLKTLRDNIEELQLPNAILSQGKHLTDTIRIAMQIVKMLDERFLWVDQLCIVQDDYVQKHSEILNMDTVYAKASLTIVAANGIERECGIKGIRNCSLPRRGTQTSYKLGKHVEATSRLLYNVQRRSFWRKRGWTFQEELLSRRRLIFEKETVHWVCGGAHWEEDQHVSRLESEPSGGRAMPDFFPKCVPDVGDLAWMIRQYNLRNLTYPEDVLAAFTGLLSGLTASFGGGFISGLPRDLFDYAIIWISNGQGRRRKASPRPFGKVCLPSWSWAGWQGDFIDTRNWRGEACMKERYDNHNCSRIDILVKWFYQEELGIDPVAIECNWSEYKERYLDSFDLEPPPGWTRYDISSPEEEYGPVSQENSEARHVRCNYRHDSRPEQEFWYPIPLNNSRDSTQTNVLAPYISCRTRRGFFQGAEEFVSYDMSSVYKWYADQSKISLRDDQNNWVGILVPNETPVKDHEEKEGKDGLSGKSIELVEVARGFRRFPSFICDCHEEWELISSKLNHGEEYQFHIVLWIEWENNIAFRKGIGRVKSEAWEAQDLEWIDLVLG